MKVARKKAKFSSAKILRLVASGFNAWLFQSGELALVLATILRTARARESQFHLDTDARMKGRRLIAEVALNQKSLMPNKSTFKTRLPNGSNCFRNLAAALLVIVATEAHADNSDFWSPKCEEWRAAFQKITFLAFDVEASRNGAELPQNVLQWKESGNRVSYEYREIPPTGKQGFSSSYCFDGTNSARTFDGRMDVRKGAWITFPDWIQNLELPTSVFEPILRVSQVENKDVGNVLILSSSETWEKFLNDVEILEPTVFVGKKCNALRIKDRYARLRGDRKFSYVLYVDPKIWLPLGWERFNEDGKLMTRFEVLQQEQLSSNPIALPTKVRVTHFAGDPPLASSEILSFWEFTFNKISFVGDDADFQFDPSSVNSIFEEDQKVFIKIPK